MTEPWGLEPAPLVDLQICRNMFDALNRRDLGTIHKYNIRMSCTSCDQSSLNVMVTVECCIVQLAQGI